MIFSMSSCSIAGSWVYERLDNYLADYFKEFANFSQEQDEEIEIISTEFINWFSENELSKVKVILENLKSINLQNPEKEISSLYKDAEGVFTRSNFYFKSPIISFTKEINEVQIDEIGSHFRELREKREKERAENGYSLIDNYISGFDRVGIKLRDDQIDKIKLKLENHIEVREEWSNLQEQWIEEFIQLLKNNQSSKKELKTFYYRKFNLNVILKNPPFYAIIFSAIMLFYGIKMPVFVVNTTEWLMYVTIFLILMSLGIALTRLKVFSLSNALISSFTRMIIGPAIGFFLIFIFDLKGFAAGVLLIQCSMPSAVLNYLVGSIYSPKKIVDSIASTIVVSTLISFVTIPIVVYIALRFFS